MMKISILSIFPEYFDSILQSSIIKRAIQQQKVTIECINIRDYASDKHQLTDDRPFGGGAGMVMKVEPIDAALAAVCSADSLPAHKVLMSAKGKMFNQLVAREYSKLDHLVIVCGHYEGVDERVAQHLVDEEVRIGDYVLTGGEAAAAVVLDAVTRLVPGVLGNEQSTVGESHDLPGELGHPVYTRPAEYKRWAVPEVLLTGNHQVIEHWRTEQRKNSQ